MSVSWTYRKKQSLCNFLLNSHKGIIFLYSINTSKICKTSKKVFEMLDDVVEKVEEKNVVQVVIYNAFNYKRTRGMLIEKMKMLF